MTTYSNHNNRDMRLRAFMEEYALLLQVFDDVSNIKKLLQSIEFLCILLIVEIICIFCVSFINFIHLCVNSSLPKNSLISKNS
jgi:hypothetical protein